MPVETRIRSEFAELVKEIIGADTYGKAAIKTSISKAYLLAMGRGQVPTRAIIEKFAQGYNADLHQLLIAADYEHADPRECYEKIVITLRDKCKGISRDDLEEVQNVVREVLGIK